MESERHANRLASPTSCPAHLVAGCVAVGYVASVLGLDRSAIAPAVFLLVLGLLGLAFPRTIFRVGRPWRRMIYDQSVELSTSGMLVTRVMGAVFILLSVAILLSA